MEKENRRKFDVAYKKRIVSEYLSGKSAKEIARRENIDPAHIYCWKTQLENRDRLNRIETIVVDENVSLEQARKIVELEEELAAYKAKVADQAMVIDLLKKLQPNSVSGKRSSGYIEIKRSLEVKRGRGK